MTQWYKLFESNNKDIGNIPKGMIEVKPSEAAAENKRGFGIFHTVNLFKGARRISNLIKINAWAVDLDKGDKQSMNEIIQKGLIPTVIVETKRGYHVYFKAKDGTKENWKRIMQDRLVPFYGADPNARDIARVLRVPGFFHMKNPNEPFLIKKIWDYKVEYSEKDILYFYPDCEAEKRKEFSKEMKKEVKFQNGDFWENIYRIDCEDALTKLSGLDIVNGDLFSFKMNPTGTKNIYVHGKTTSAWIDKDQKIGSLSKGGPTIYQWLRWYGHSPNVVVEVIKNLYPEIEAKNGTN